MHKKGCEKCGSEEIKGPRYIETGRALVIGRLQYVCEVCGYVWMTSTKDDKDSSR